MMSKAAEVTELQRCSVLDINVLADMYGDSSATTRVEVLTGFNAEAGRYVVQLQAAVTLLNMASVIAMSHSLKSMCGLIGAQQFAQLCMLLEQAGRDGHEQRLTDLSAQLQPCWQALQVAILFNSQVKGHTDG
jgi:HPt (histidine-containing phosphotransfer) domain-containing protein